MARAPSPFPRVVGALALFSRESVPIVATAWRARTLRLANQEVLLLLKFLPRRLHVPRRLRLGLIHHRLQRGHPFVGEAPHFGPLPLQAVPRVR